MAIDRNALDAITGERKGKKNQSRFEDRNKLTIGGPDGKPMTVQGERLKGNLLAVPYSEVSRAAGNAPTTMIGNARSSVMSRPLNPEYQPGQATAAPNGLGPRQTASAPKPAEPERQPAKRQSAPLPSYDDEMYGDTGLISASRAGREITARPPEAKRPFTVQDRKRMADEVLAGERQRLRQVTREDEAMAFAQRAGRPEQSSRPLQAQGPMPTPTIGQTTTTAQAPTVEPLTPSYVQSDSASKRDALRAQIASEQQRMLTARRTAEGARRRGVEIEPFNEGASLKKIAEMRSELAGYEKAAMPVQQIKVKTAEQNLATEQDVSRQAADIMQRDVEDLRYQLDLMPEGQAKASMQERLRSLEYQQQQQSARGRVLAPTEAGPQVRGASPELYQQMLQEGEARTQRQREAAPRVAARQEALGEAAYRAAEGQQSGRLQAQQRQADFERAMQEATIAEIGAPERRRQLEEQTIQSKLGIETEESKARVAKMQAETGLTNVQARAADNAIKSLASREDITKKSAEADIEAKTLANLFNREKLKAIQEGRGYDPEVAAMKDAAVARSMNKLGITPEAEKGVTMAAEALKANIGRSVTGATVYSIPTDAIEDVKRAAQMNSYVLGLKALYDQGGDAKDIATNKARLLFNMFTGPIEGQRIGGGTYASNIGTAAATGAATVGAIGAGIGSVVPGAGTLAGGGFGALVGGGSAAAGATAITLGADLLTRTGLMTNAEAEGVKTNFNQMYTTLQQMAR
jgi:hypothetical protein